MEGFAGTEALVPVGELGLVSLACGGHDEFFSDRGRNVWHFGNDSVSGESDAAGGRGSERALSFGSLGRRLLRRGCRGLPRGLPVDGYCRAANRGACDCGRSAIYLSRTGAGFVRSAGRE